MVPVTEPVVPVTEPVVPVTEPVVPVTEPVVPVTEPVVPVTEPVLPPSLPVSQVPQQFPPVPDQLPGSNEGGSAQNGGSNGGEIDAGQGDTGQAGGTDGGSGVAGGTEAGLKPEPGAGAKGSSISSSITTGSAGVDLSASGLGVGSESMGVVLGVATGSVVHSISSGDFGFSFGSGSGGGGGGRNHQDERDSHNEAGGPGITPLPPLIHIGPPLPDNNVNEVVNSPPALPPLPPVELPGPGDMDDIIIDAVIDAVNQHAGDGPADGGDSGDEQGNAPAPVPPQASGNANVNGAHAFIAHAREAIVHMQAATAAALGLVYTVEARYNEARQGFEAAEEAFEEFHTMADNGVVLDDFDYANLDLAEAQMARWTAIMNDSDSFLDYQHVFVNQQTAGINIMRALIAQAQAQLAGWDAQAGIADANANPDNAGGDAVGDGAANGGHAGAIGADPNAGALPGGGGNAGQDPAGDQPDQAPAPVDEPDADLPPNIVIANEVIAQGNALIAAMHARVALREAAIVQNETLIANTQHNITWLQDTIVAGQHMIDYNGIVTSRQNLINWWRELITNTQALISEAQADLNRALQDMIEVQGQIAQARAEVDAWFHRDAVAGVQGALPGVDVVDADAIVHQEDAPGPARVTGAALPPEQGDVDASPVVFDGDADYSAVPVPVPPPAPYVPVLIPLPDPGPAPVIIDPNAIDPVLDQEALDDDAGMDAGHENNSDGETGSDDDGIEVDDPPPFEMDDNDHAAMDGAPLVPPPVPQDLPEIHQDALDDFIQDGVIDAVINHAPEDNPANDANPEHLEPDVDAGSAPGDDAVSEAPSDPDQDSDDNADDASDAEGNDDDAGDGQGGGDDEDGNTDGGNGADDDGGADDGGADDGGADDGGADDGGADDGGADDGGADGGSGADDGTDEDGDEAMPPPPPNNNAGGDPVLPPVVPVPAHIAELGTILTNVNGAQARIDHAQAAINQMQAEIDAGELALEATIGMIVDEQDNIAEQVAAIAHMHDLLNQGLVANEQAAATISIAQAAIANARITINDVATASDDLRAMIGAGQEAIAHWHAVIAEALAEIAALQAQVQAANADDLPPDDGGPDGGADDPGEAGDAGDAGFEDGNDGDDAGLHDDGNAPADEAIPPANQGGNVLAGADLLPVQNGLVAAPVPPAALPDNLTSAQAHIAHAEAVIAQLQAEMHAAGLAIEAAVNLLGEQQAIVTNEEETAAHMHYLINEGLANADEPDAISHDIANVEDAEAAISIAESNIADAMTAMNDVERIIQDNRAFIEATQTVIEHWQAVIAQALEEIAAGPGQAVDVHETAGAPDDDPDDEPDAGSGSGSGTGTGAGAPSDAGTAEDEHVHAGMQADPDALASAGHGSHGSVNDADSAPVTAGSGIDPGTLARRSQWLIVELDSTPGHAASSHGLPDAGGIAQNLPMIRAVIENWSRSMPSSVSVELAGFDFFDAQAGAPASLAIELTMRSAGPSGAAGLLAPDAVLLLKSSIQAYLASGEPVQGSAPAVVDTGVAEPIAEIATVATVAASEPDILTLDNTGMATMTVALFPEDTLQVFGNVAADVAGPPSTIDGNWDIVIIAAPEIALIW